MEKWRLLRRTDLIKKFVERFGRYADSDKGHTLMKWRKNAKLDEQIQHGTIIQKFCKGVLEGILKKRQDAIDMLRKSLYEMYREKFFQDLSEIAPAVNDLLSKKLRQKRKLGDTLDEVERQRLLKILRYYFNYWRYLPKERKKRKERKLSEPKEPIDGKVILIQKRVRMLLADKKLRGLKRLQDLLYKLYLFNKNKGEDLLGYTLRKWRAAAKKVECDENSTIIQKFCHIKLDKYLNEKFYLLLQLLSDKYCIKLLKDIAKVNKLNKALRHRPLTDGMDALKKKAREDYLREILLQLLNDFDDKNKKDILKYYLDKWRKKVNEIKRREEEAATEINKIVRGHLYRKNHWIIEERLRLLMKIFERINDNDYLNSALRRWRKNAKQVELENNATIIQKFCRSVRNKLLRNRFSREQDNYQILAKVLNKITISPQEFFDRLKEIYRLSILKDLIDDLNKNRLDKLKYAFDKIKEYPRKKKLGDLLNIPDDLRLRLLKKYLDLWRQKAFRNKAIMTLLKSIFNTYEDFQNNLLRSTLYKWSKNAHLITQERQATIIQDFCRGILDKIYARRNWLKLSLLLRNLHIGEDKDAIIRRLREYFGLEKLKKPIVRHARKDVLDALKNNGKGDKFWKIVGPIKARYRKNDELSLLREYFEKWRDMCDRQKEKEDKLNEMLDLLEKVRNKKSTPNVEYASIIKRLFKALPYLKALVCLRRLRDYAFNKNKNENLADDLVRAKNDLIPKIENDLIKKVYKVYAYKVLSKFIKNLERLQRRKMRPLKRDFLSRLYDILLKQAECQYKNKKSNENVPLKSKNSFRLKKPKVTDVNNNKRLTYVSLIPYLVKYLNEKVLKRKKEAFDALKDASGAERFCILYKKWAEQTELPHKRDLIDRLKAEVENKNRSGPLLEKLYRLLRQSAIKRMLESAGLGGRYAALLYLIKLIEMNKGLAKERWLRALIRRWRYIAFSKKLAAIKMKTIYKNLHLTYLEVANCLFGEESKTDPSIIKEFERFGTSVGMWENEKPNRQAKEKYVEEIKTQYMFNDIGFEEFLEEKYAEEVKAEAEAEGGKAYGYGGYGYKDKDDKKDYDTKGKFYKKGKK